MKHQPVLRGAVSVRADATTEQAIVAQINTTLEEFKAAHKEEIDGVNKRFEDVVSLDKLEKIQAELSDLTKAHDTVKASLEAAKLGPQGGSQKSPEQAEYDAAFENFFRFGRDTDKLEAAVKSGKVQAAATVGTDSEGGYTAPVEWDRTITDKRVEISEMRMYAGIQSVSGQGFTKIYNLRGTNSGWVGETDARPETNTSTLASYAFSFGEIYANPGATSRILQDSEIDIAAWLSSEVNTEFALQEGTAFVSGDGTNKPKGILNYDAAAEGALAPALQHPLGPITEVNTGAAAAITSDGILDLIYDLPANRSAGASFYANRSTIATVRKLKDGDGNYLWERSFQEGQPASVAGFPIRELSGMPNVAGGNIAMIFGNMSEGYRIFDRVGTTVLRDPYTNKPYIMFYVTQRVGGGLWNPEWLRYHRVAA